MVSLGMQAITLYRWLGRFLVLLGLIQAGLLLRSEIKGETRQGGNRISRGTLIYRDVNPRGFRSALNARWINASLVPAAGLAVLAICRRASRMDLLAADAPEYPALDELEKTLDAEADSRNRPSS